MRPCVKAGKNCRSSVRVLTQSFIPINVIRRSLFVCGTWKWQQVIRAALWPLCRAEVITDLHLRAARRVASVSTALVPRIWQQSAQKTPGPRLEITLGRNDRRALRHLTLSENFMGQFGYTAFLPYSRASWPATEQARSLPGQPPRDAKRGAGGHPATGAAEAGTP